MTPQEYIQSKLEEVRQFSHQEQPKNNEQLQAAIFRIVMSKKFRKYSANSALIDHIKNAIKINVEKGEPINVTYVNGGYKLWRLAESPEADWAELFSLMRYVNWLKSICKIYSPGVWLDFYMDDLIVPIMNNVPARDPHAYVDSFRKLINFLKPYLPENFTITVTKVGDQFESVDAFKKSLQNSIEIVKKGLTNGLPALNDTVKRSIELNVKASPAQQKDPHWREKVAIIHEAYFLTKAEAGYHNKPNQIKAFTQPLPSGTALAVGTTGKSIMKFWIGAGVLSQNGESFSQEIFSPAQIEKGAFTTEAMNISGLDGKNFSQIRVIN